MIKEKKENFESFGFNEALLKAIGEAGFQSPSPIQSKAIPVVLAGQDLVAQAQTGTGKTAAFALPLMQQINLAKSFEILVITPTRELAMQVTDEFFKLGKYLGIKAVTLCGGKSSASSLDQIKRGAQVVVATPGRLLDLLESRKLSSAMPSMIVLDEADEMLNMGFLEDVQKILQFFSNPHQTLLFSATMPLPIQQLAKKFLKQPVLISVTQKETTNQDIAQLYTLVQEKERQMALERLLYLHDPEKSIIFCRTRKDVHTLCKALNSKNLVVEGLHGEMEQPQREEVMRGFRTGRIRCLVATDIAARGLNVIDISHVYNYHVPFDSESYVHRIGRTGRAGRKGIAVSLITPQELRSFQKMERNAGTKIEHFPVPSLKALKEKQLAKLLSKVEAQAVAFDVAEIIGRLAQEDLALFTSKLLSFFLEKDLIEGPEEIGLCLKSVEKNLDAGQQKQRRPRRRGSREHGFRSKEAFSAKRKKRY